MSIEVLRTGYFPDISVWPAAMFEGSNVQWRLGKIAFHIADAATQAAILRQLLADFKRTCVCTLIISKQLSEYNCLRSCTSDAKSAFPQSPLYIAALEHGCWPDGNIRKISEIYPMRRTSIAVSHGTRIQLISYSTCLFSG